MVEQSAMKGRKTSAQALVHFEGAESPQVTPSVQHASFTDIIRPRTVCIVQAAVR
jgi:hypothetical protein